MEYSQMQIYNHHCLENRDYGCQPEIIVIPQGSIRTARSHNVLFQSITTNRKTYAVFFYLCWKQSFALSDSLRLRAHDELPHLLPHDPAAEGLPPKGKELLVPVRKVRTRTNRKNLIKNTLLLGARTPPSSARTSPPSAAPLARAGSSSPRGWWRGRETRIWMPSWRSRGGSATGAGCTCPRRR